MTPCAVFTHALYELDSGEADPVLLVRWREHLAVCDDCAALAETYRLTVVLAGRLPPQQPPDALMVTLARTLGLEPGVTRDEGAG